MSMCLSRLALSYLLDMLRIVQIDIRIAKMLFEPVVEIRVLGTAGNFGKRITFQGVDAAETLQTIGVSCHLLADPIVLCFHVSILIGNWWLIGVSVAVHHQLRRVRG
jgi:hypothetical protein